MSPEPRWLSKALLIAVHGRLLAEHGGPSGLRDEELRESALASPRHRSEYENGDLFDLASAYAFALTANHPFVDGNKRVAFTAAGVFLELNGLRLRASEIDAVQAVLALSKGEMDAPEFADWLRLNCESAIE